MFFACILNRPQHALNAAFAESAGHQQPVVVFQLRLVTLVDFVSAFQPLGLNPVHIQLEVVRQRAVNQRLF